MSLPERGTWPQSGAVDAEVEIAAVDAQGI
jgi:hypothetical protein